MILRAGVFYVLTWFFTMLIGGLQQEAGLLPGLTFLPQWGPGIAGLITMLVFSKRDGVRITFFSPRMPPLRYLWMVLLPLGFGLLPFLFARLFIGLSQTAPITAAMVAQMLAGAVGEEIGWRGYLHRRMAPHLNGLLSSLAVGVMWTLFHIHFWQGGVLYVVFAGLGLTSFSLMMYALLAEYEFNVLGATLFHLVINLTSALCLDFVSSFDLPFMIAYGVIAALIAGVIVFVRRDQFF